jgi:hypothetical protein
MNIAESEYYCIPYEPWQDYYFRGFFDDRFVLSTDGTAAS